MKSKKVLGIMVAIIIGLIFAGGYYYVALPPINIHAPGFWSFIIVALLMVLVIYGLMNIRKPNISIADAQNFDARDIKIKFKSRKSEIITKAIVFVTAMVIIVFIGGSIISSPLVNASKYQQLLTVEDGNFASDIKPVSYDKIPVLDKDSAAIIGSRVMGTMVDMVSQYEVDNNYVQINYNDKPFRVTPLKYGNLIKWFTNNGKGITAYIKIDMTTQVAESVKLTEGIKYSTSDHFNRNIYRHLRFAYPTYIFDTLNFEIDDSGTPYWVCPVKKYNIGLFGGVTIGQVVLCNAITGELTSYEVKDVPKWVDKVYSGDLLIELYNYYGTLKHGYFNSVLGQKDCLKTTEGYNYIDIDGAVWLYTGITSVGEDQANVGFVLMNQRTMETRYYEIAGADEQSAMSSAEGQVQQLGYTATFPLLLNIAGEPTYFMALKDSSGLVKQYAMLNIEKYQTVATAETVNECEKAYVALLADNGITKPKVLEDKTVTGIITKIAQMVVGGNSHYYIMVDSSQDIYDVSVADYIDIIKYNVGDKISFKFNEGTNVKTVIGITK